MNTKPITVKSIYRNATGQIATLVCDQDDNVVSADVNQFELNADGRTGRELDHLIRSMGYAWIMNQ